MSNQEYVSLQMSDVEETSKLAIFDDENPEISMMEQQALEYINLSGAETRVYLRVNDLGKVDDVWEEDNDPLYESPVPVRGQFVPEKMSAALKKWGYESNSKFEINFSRANLLALFNVRLIRIGDVIEIPHNTLVQTQNTEFIDGKIGMADKFRVLDAKDTGNFNYRWLYWTCTVELLTGDITVRPPDA